MEKTIFVFAVCFRYANIWLKKLPLFLIVFLIFVYKLLKLNSCSVSTHTKKRRQIRNNCSLTYLKVTIVDRMILLLFAQQLGTLILLFNRWRSTDFTWELSDCTVCVFRMCTFCWPTILST